MSAVTQNEYTGNGNTTTYSFTFPYLKTSDIKASLDAVATTAFTLANATTLQFNTAPGNGVKIKIFRETGVDNLTATFYAGSAIKSEDLNDNFTQNLFVTQEVNQRYLSTLGGTMTGDLALGEDAKIVFEGATDDANETTLTVADPTADRTITLPNVSGNVVTTGDTGTVTSTMLADGTIVTADLANDAVRTAKILDGNVTGAKIAADAITGAKIADDQINSEHYVDESIDTAHIADSQITNAKMANNSVNTAELVDDAVTADKLASNSVVSASIVDGSIVEADIADNAITNVKMADDSVGAAELVDTSVGTAALASNAVTLAKMADNSVGTSELVDDAVTTVKIANDQVTTAKILDSNVTTNKINNDAITSAKIADNAVGNEHLQDDSVRTPEIQNGAVTAVKIGTDAVITTKIQDNAVTTAKIADAELTTLAGMQSGTASKLADSTALTADIADLNQIDGLTKQTTISDSDASFPTSGAVVDYVAAQIAPLGGLEVIATEVAFPNTQPQAGVVISISDAGGVVFNGSGTSTTGRTVGGSTVTINNAPSSLNSETLVAGVGLMVSSTGSGQVYNYHKILGKEDDIKQLSDDINDFNARYRVGSSNPTSALDAGDLFFNTSTSKLLVYNATNSAWEEAQSIGNFFISTLSPAFDNNTQNFTITNAPTNAEQIVLSINGVIQKPNAGTSTPSEGFALDGSTIKLAAAPASGSSYFAVVIGSTVNIGQPSNNTVSTAVLQNSSVATGKIADDAVTAAKIGTLTADVDFNDNAKARFGTGNDLKIYHTTTGNSSYILNSTGNLNIGSNNEVRIKGGDDAAEHMGRFIDNGAVELYFDGTKKFETTTAGVSVTGNIDLPDNTSGNASLRFGNSQDFFMNHNGTDSYIINNTGDLYIRDLNGDVHIQGKDNEESIIAKADGAVELYHNNNKKLETTANGIEISNGEIQIYNSSNEQYIVGTGNIINIRPNTTENAIRIHPDGAVELYHDANLKAATYTDGLSVTGSILCGGGIINSTGGNAHIVLDSGTGSASGLQTSYIDVKHNGTLKANIACVEVSSGEPSLDLNPQGTGAVKLYHAGYIKLYTHTNGIVAVGNLGAGDHTAAVNWTNVIYAGDNMDLQFKHDGSNSVIENYTGDLYVQNNGTNESGHLYLRAKGGDNSIACYNDAGVELFHDGTKIVSTSATGILFNNDTSADNALGDYEKGTFTPVFRAHDSTTGQVSGSGFYTKIGNRVFLNVSFQNLNTTGLPTSGIGRIAGLPYAAVGVGAEYNTTTTWMSHNITLRESTTFYTENGQSHITGIYGNSGAAWSNTQITDFRTTGFYLNFNMSYRTE